MVFRLLALFFLTSCALYQGQRSVASQSGNSSCFSKMNALIKENSSKISLFSQLQKHKILSKDNKLAILQQLTESNRRGTNFTSEEWDNFLPYLETLPKKKRTYAIENLEEFLNPEKTEISVSYQKYLDHFKSYEEKQRKKFLEKYGDSPQTRSLMRENIDQYRRLYNGCHAKGITEQHVSGGKLFSAFTIGISSLSSGAMYTYSNRNEEEFLEKEFFGKLGYEMTADGIWALLASVIFKDPNGSFLGKSLKMYAADNTLVATDAFTWDFFFGGDSEEAEIRLKEILSSPEKQRELLRLKALLEDESFTDKVTDKFYEIIKVFKTNSENEDFQLTEENLDSEEGREMLLRAVMKELYEEERGELSSGNEGVDRYLYYSGVGIPFMFLDALVTLKIYKTMCMAPLNPKMAFIKSALIFSAYSVFYDVLNYPLRKELINQ